MKACLERGPSRGAAAAAGFLVLVLRAGFLKYVPLVWVAVSENKKVLASRLGTC